MKQLGIAALCALVAGVVVCLIAWPHGPPPVSEGNGPPLSSVSREGAAVYAGILGGVLAGTGALVVMVVRLRRARRLPAREA